ncbi:MAG: D-alanyl-D-alanine carboxypeptidase family protein [Gammaproteobacteria bacterium]|jgi:D-alanyl-D-alanine carboxypeptidase (penicillin-binding protein 5/6)
MLKRPSIMAALSLLALSFNGLAAETPTPAPPAVNAEAYLLVDYFSGETLAEKEADRKVEPASITKVMTAFVIFKELEAGNLSLQDMVTVSDHAWRKSMGTSRMFLEPRTQVPVEQMLMGMIVQSGNDASIALAEHVAGSEETFAEVMNAYAEKLGMTGTHFTNSTGLPNPEHYTTARDLVRLASAMIREFPDYYRWYSQPEYTYNGITQPNRNRLLRLEEGADGIKTGWTESAGYCLLASVARDDRRLISVVLDSPSERTRTAASKALMSYGMRFFETHRLYAAGEEVTRVRVWKGDSESVALSTRDDLYVTVARGRYDDLSAVMNVQSPLMAPLPGDVAVGELQVSLDDESLITRPLYPSVPVPEGSIWQRLSDTVLLWFE